MKSDVVIVGGGPAGAASAIFLAEEGIKPLILEQEAFPRYHIGESMTGEAGLVLRQLGLGDEMYRRRYPIKKGVKVYGQSTRGTWFVPVMGRDPNWKLFEQETWQVRRSDFDKLLLDEAVKRGATLVKGKALKPLCRDDGTVTGVQTRLADSANTTDIGCEVLLDCSGQATWLANLQGVTGPKYVGSYDKQIAIFSQIVGAHRDNGTTRDTFQDNTLIFYQKKFHWAWFIPIDEEVVSVGVVIPSAYFLDKKESKHDFLLREMNEIHPDLKRRVEGVRLVEDVHVIPNYSYQVKSFCGKGYMCIGDSHRFVDPIFSFGLMVALREAKFAAPVIKSYLAGSGRDCHNPFADYQRFCEQGIDVLEDVLDAFWEQPAAFALFVYLRHREEMMDVFGGRIYERQPSTAVNAFRKLLGREGLREQSYEHQDLYSIPIGSRYHPERAAIWVDDHDIECTEAWMR